MNPSLGVRAFVDGFRLSRHPELRRYTWLPALVSFAIIGTGLYFAFGYLSATSARLIADLPAWLSWLELLLTPLIYLIGFLAGAWLFALLAVLIASPFLGVLSAHLEAVAFGDAPVSDTSLWTDISQSLAREARKLVYHLPRLVIVFLITLIPVINLVAPVIWLLFGAWTMAVQFADYPTENRQRPFKETLERLKANRTVALAFGLCATGALAIPLLNFLLIPVAVAGGTLLWRYLDGERVGEMPQPK
jgi:CysZ protein